MFYHLMGSLMAASFMFTVAGLGWQLGQVLRRRALARTGGLPAAERATSILSLNQLISLFIAVFAFFLYGISLEPTNHYLAWPRLLAALVVVAIFWQMAIDRRNASCIAAFALAVVLLAGAPLLLWLEPTQRFTGTSVAQGLVLASTVILGQGYWHQIRLIRKTGRTGAVSLRFHQCVLVTALCTVGFGMAMGLRDGWPLIVLASVSATLKVITLWHFRWARTSPSPACGARRWRPTGRRGPLRAEPDADGRQFQPWPPR